MRYWVIIFTLIACVAYADSTVTVCPSGCDYTSVESALDANQMDIPTVLGDNNLFIIQITGDWTGSSDVNQITDNGYTTDANNYIYIYTDAQARHPGYLDATKYQLKATTNIAVQISSPYTRIYGLQILDQYSSGAATSVYLTSTADSARLAYCIIYNDVASSGAKNAIYAQQIGQLIFNNIIYDYNDNSGDRALYGIPGSGEVVRFFNNTVVNCRLGMYDQTNRVNAQNNLFQGCVARANVTTFDANTDYNTTDSSSFEYTHTTTDDSVDATITFVSSSDFHLGSQQHNNGVDLSAIFTDDIDGNTRSSWNRGADEYTAGAAATKYWKILK